MADDNTLSLFPEIDRKPTWEFAGLPHIDFISDEPTSVAAFVFQIKALEEVSGIYSRPIYRALLLGLHDLSKSKNKTLRERSFTIFAGDILSCNVFVVALETENAELTNFMASYFGQVPGYETLEATSSRDLSPAFRYDKGYVIEYSDGGLEGTTYEDTPDYYGSGLVIHRRCYELPENIGKKRSMYGRLTHEEAKSTALTNQKFREAENRLLEQLKRSDAMILDGIARSKQFEDKALEFLIGFVGKLPEQQSRVDSTTGEENQVALQQYFKTLEDIEKCAQAARKARQQQIDAKQM